MLSTLFFYRKLGLYELLFVHGMKQKGRQHLRAGDPPL
jgi:hypothetical protein